MSIWEELGIEPTQDSGAIRRAYTTRLRKVKPESDPKGFQRLRAAYEAALQGVAPAAPGSVPEPQPAPSPAALEPIEARDETPPAVPERVPEPPLYQSTTTLIERLRSATAANRLRIFTETLQQEGWEGLEFQSRLQHVASRLLLTHFDRLQDVVPAVAEGFGWANADRKVSTTDPVAREVLARTDARKWCASIEASPGRGSNVREALRLLRGPVDARRFTVFAESTRAFSVMEDLVKELHQEQQTALRYEINRESMQWWINYLQTREKSKADTAMAKKKPAKTPTWVYVVLILGGLQLVRLCTPSNTGVSRSSAYDDTPKVVLPVGQGVGSFPLSDAAKKVGDGHLLADLGGEWSDRKMYFSGMIVSYRGSMWRSRETVSIGELPPGQSSKWVPLR